MDHVIAVHEVTAPRIQESCSGSGGPVVADHGPPSVQVMGGVRRRRSRDIRHTTSRLSSVDPSPLDACHRTPRPRRSLHVRVVRAGVAHRVALPRRGLGVDHRRVPRMRDQARSPTAQSTGTDARTPPSTEAQLSRIAQAYLRATDSKRGRAEHASETQKTRAVCASSLTRGCQ
jgi:uncharacterized protein involved in copper resistance